MTPWGHVHQGHLVWWWWEVYCTDDLVNTYGAVNIAVYYLHYDKTAQCTVWYMTLSRTLLPVYTQLYCTLTDVGKTSGHMMDLVWVSTELLVWLLYFLSIHPCPLEIWANYALQSLVCAVWSTSCAASGNSIFSGDNETENANKENKDAFEDEDVADEEVDEKGLRSVPNYRGQVYYA